MEKCRIFTGRTIIGIDDAYYEVHLFRENVKLEESTCYIKGDYVYLFKGKGTLANDIKEGEMYIIDGKCVIGTPHTPEMQKKFSVDNIIELNVENLFANLKTEYYTTPETVEAINNNSEVFAPMINPGDDFLKKLIKEVLIEKQINLKNYKDKFASQNDLNNMKSGLTHATKMSTTYFEKWKEVLGVSGRYVLTDNGTDKLAPLKKEIVYDDNEKG